MRIVLHRCLTRSRFGSRRLKTNMILVVTVLLIIIARVNMIGCHSSAIDVEEVIEQVIMSHQRPTTLRSNCGRFHLTFCQEESLDQPRRPFYYVFIIQSNTHSFHFLIQQSCAPAIIDIEGECLEQISCVATTSQRTYNLGNIKNIPHSGASIGRVSPTRRHLHQESAFYQKRKHLLDSQGIDKATSVFTMCSRLFVHIGNLLRFIH